jgi:hypothetical protein
MFVSEGKQYRYKGITFDWHDHLGPIILNRHTWNERPLRSVGRRQWRLFGKWLSLSEYERELYRI